MVREISAGGVVIRRQDGLWWVAVIEPAGAPTATDTPARTAAGKTKKTLALPKGLVDDGEKPVATALREVFEETGITAELLTKLADIKYVYQRSWGDGARVFKIVTFYLMRYLSGNIGEITDAMRIEVADAKWVPLQDAARLLSYSGEKQMARKALQFVQEHGEL